LARSLIEPARASSRAATSQRSNLAGPAAQLRLDESETLSLPLRLSQSHTPTPTSARRLGDSRVPSPPPTSPRHLARPVVPGSPARPSDDLPPRAGAPVCLAAGAPVQAGSTAAGALPPGPLVVGAPAQEGSAGSPWAPLGRRPCEGGQRHGRRPCAPRGRCPGAPSPRPAQCDGTSSSKLPLPAAMEEDEPAPGYFFKLAREPNEPARAGKQAEPSLRFSSVC